MDRWEWRLTVPLVGVMSPVISFSRVDLPAPLGPTRAIRLSQSMPNSRFCSFRQFVSLMIVIMMLLVFLLLLLSLFLFIIRLIINNSMILNC